MPVINSQQQIPKPVILSPQGRQPSLELIGGQNEPPRPVDDEYRFLAPDAGEKHLPPDWCCSFFRLTMDASDPTYRYMRICSLAAEVLHKNDPNISDELPIKNLECHWVGRNRHQFQTSASPDDTPPPPPYEAVVKKRGDETLSLAAMSMLWSNDDNAPRFPVPSLADPLIVHEGPSTPSLDDGLFIPFPDAGEYGGNVPAFPMYVHAGPPPAISVSVSPHEPLMAPEQTTSPSSLTPKQGLVRRTSASFKSTCFFLFVCFILPFFLEENLGGWTRICFATPR